MSISKVLEESTPPDNKCPYICTINISLSFSKVLPDGNIAPFQVQTDKLLNEHGISNNGIFTIFGFTLEECIENTKRIIGQLNYEDRNGK